MRQNKRMADEQVGLPFDLDFRSGKESKHGLTLNHWVLINLNRRIATSQSTHTKTSLNVLFILSAL